MKILFFMNHVDQGGAALALFDLIKEIVENHKDIEPIVVTGKRNNLNISLTAIGVENYSVGFKNFISTAYSPKWIWKILYAIRYYINRNKAIRKIEKIIDLKSIDIIHSNLNRIDIGAILAKKHKIPHIWHIREFESGGFDLLSFRSKPIEYMNSFASNFIFISKSIEESWIEKGIKGERFQLIYDGVREELYRFNDKLIPNEIIKCVFLGGYCISKGQEELIEALNKLPDNFRKKITVDFYGNGNRKYIQRLKEQLEKYELDSVVTINGYVSDIWKKMPEYDIGFNCSRAEGFGRVTVEYMMSGLCPFVSNGGANQELVEDGISGVVYQKGDSLCLSKQLEELILNPDRITKLGLCARKRALEKFTMRRHAVEVVNTYKRIV